MKKLSPIVLFVYNRPLHTRKTIEALAGNELAKESELYIYSDFPKNEQAAESVRQVRDYIRTVNTFKETHVIERTENMGLARSVVSGISEVINKYGKVIVLEDDLLTSPYFLKFMNEALDNYEQEKRVMHVSGYVYPAKNVKYPPLFFWRVVSCWGWGTWKDRWQFYQDDANYLYSEIMKQKKLREFDLNSYGFFADQLLRNISGKKNTWAIKWQASILVKDGLCLNTGISLIKNIGFGNDATNTKFGNDAFEKQRIDMEYQAKAPLIPIEESLEVPAKIRGYFWSRSYNDVWLGTYLKIKSFIRYHLRKFI